MRIRKLAAAGAAVAVLGAIALPATTASAQVEPEITVEKVVLGNTDTTEFEFTVECETTMQPESTPSGISDPFVLMDGESEGITQSDLDTSFDDGVDCQVVETALGTPPSDAWAVITTSEGDIIEPTDGVVPIGADFAWDFTTLEGEFVENYDVIVINDYTVDGTAAELCAYVVDQLGTLQDIADSFADFENQTPQQLADLFEVSIEFFLGGSEVAPPEISDSWDAVTIAYIQVGQILSDAGFDVTALSEEDIASIDAILGAVGPDAEAVITFLGTECVPTTTTTAAAAAAATPRYAG